MVPGQRERLRPCSLDHGWCALPSTETCSNMPSYTHRRPQWKHQLRPRGSSQGHASANMPSCTYQGTGAQSESYLLRPRCPRSHTTPAYTSSPLLLCPQSQMRPASFCESWATRAATAPPTWPWLVHFAHSPMCKHSLQLPHCEPPSIIQGSLGTYKHLGPCLLDHARCAVLSWGVHASAELVIPRRHMHNCEIGMHAAACLQAT